jgi:hypothetical protein
MMFAASCRELQAGSLCSPNFGSVAIFALKLDDSLVVGLWDLVL